MTGFSLINNPALFLLPVVAGLLNGVLATLVEYFDRKRNGVAYIGVFLLCVVIPMFAVLIGATSTGAVLGVTGADADKLPAFFIAVILFIIPSCCVKRMLAPLEALMREALPRHRQRSAP